MTTTVNLRKTLDRKQWEMCNVLPVSSAAGYTIVSSNLHDQYQAVLTSTTTALLYDPQEDAWITLPTTTAITGTYGAGTCGTHHPNGPSGTATAGSSNTITTNLTLPASLSGYTIRLTGGTGAGQERIMSSNTLGANSVITVSQNWTTPPDATTTYQLFTGRFYFLVGGSGGPGMRYYDFATNTWSAALTMTGVAAMGTDAKLRGTPSFRTSFATGTATSATTNTLSNSAKAWATNQWTNYQIRITGGTGVGQVRTISSNTGTQITVSSNWTVTPNATSTYVIEGNDDFLYLIGNAAVTMYRYSISGNTWTTLTPAVARAAAPGAGTSLNWIRKDTNGSWDDENNIINGRRLYSFRGGGSGIIDYYDISSNSWTAVGVPPFSAETFTTGSVYDNGGNGNIYAQKDATGRFFKYDAGSNTLLPWHTLMYPQGAAVVGDRMFTIEYTDGGTTLKWVYFISSTSNIMFRSLVI